jgi:putative toxin-antitoxin system antitoxin component (TIGR02293 family)
MGSMTTTGARTTEEARPEQPKLAGRRDGRPERAAPKSARTKASFDLLEKYRRRFSHQAIVEGIDAGLVKQGIRQGILRLDEVQRFIPASTLARKMRERRKLGREEADQVARLLWIKAYAQAVFEDASTAEVWLTEPNPALGTRLPIDLLVTDEGTRAVETVLRRIDYGDYS